MKFSRGISLVEIIVALAIFTLGIMALLRIELNIRYAQDVAKQQSEAMAIGQRQMEIFRGYQTITSAAGVFAYNDIATGSTTVAGANTTYTLSYTVTTNATPAYKTVDMTVSWTDRRSVARSLRLTSIIASIDPVTSGNVI